MNQALSAQVLISKYLVIIVEATLAVALVYLSKQTAIKNYIAECNRIATYILCQ